MSVLTVPCLQHHIAVFLKTFNTQGGRHQQSRCRSPAYAASRTHGQLQRGGHAVMMCLSKRGSPAPGGKCGPEKTILSHLQTSTSASARRERSCIEHSFCCVRQTGQVVMEQTLDNCSVHLFSQPMRSKNLLSKAYCKNCWWLAHQSRHKLS